MSAGGSDLNSIEVDDAHSAAITLPFNFGYNGAFVSSIKVNSNGWISMDTGDAPNASQGNDNSSFGSANGAVRPAICALWDDLDGASGTARYETTGSAPNRVFTMEWRNWQWNYQASGVTISFECKLYETTNVIEFVYRQESGSVNSASASIGLLASASGSYYSLNGTGTSPTASTSTATTNLNTKPATGQIYRFTPSCGAAANISAISSNTPICATSTLNLSLTATGTAPLSYAWTGTGTFSSTTAEDPTVTGAATGTYAVTVRNWCGTADTDNTSVTVIQAPTVANAGPDQTICLNDGSTTLAANTPTQGTGAWSILAGSPNTSTAQLSSTTSPTATFSPTAAGTYTLRWTISNSPCTASSNDVVITVNPTPSAPTMTPTSGSICAGSSLGLAASLPNVTSTFTGGSFTLPALSGTSTPYPSAITVSGLPASGVTVSSITLNGVTHANPDDIDMLLRSPSGTNVVLMSDVGGSGDITGNNYVIQDGASSFADNSTNASGTYAATNIGASDDYPSPGPGTISQGSPALSLFTGNMNGTWNMYTRDDGVNLQGGSISSWSITFSVPMSYAWAPATVSPTNTASVTATPLGTTTYTVTATHPITGCENTNTVTVTVIDVPNAGSDNTLTICSNDAAADMGALLGSHDAGTWSGPSSVSGDLYDPATMSPGNYVYTVVAAPCPNATATITVTENTAVLYYADVDGDGFGSGSGTLACAPPNAGDVTNDTDLCPTDPTKQVPGQCGCGNPETDTDSDGTADCNDLCPLDANKIVPGICGCGVSDADTDGDLTVDCNDLCPLDANKIAPGICGCGVSDADTDGDLTVDCNDGCPLDANKTAPGICGCGISDADTDGDLTVDCNDGCPLDPNKTAPGQCGCGNLETDTDLDGTADCVDGCPSDPNKIAPGVCGCGVSDVDTDGDLTADCNDLCPNDPNKVAPGVCGCGVSDVDTDGDLTADCNDLCPLDANKVAPGICGCGVSDIDTDGDLTVDCNDLCPLDPNKVDPGQCGCGNPETDTDLDGTADCNDACPTDPDKIAPGICGCETPDTDTDGDGLADCVDPCIDDVNNSDTDSDGTPDCTDNCPLDANKVNPGICGCGVADTDTDGDTYADCVDGCPADANKIAPGVCGCGTADADSDGDGTLNCNDGCPNDPNKLAPGVCGCGTSDVDSDNDGLADCNDNCPSVSGQVGGTCDDGNAGTINDVLNNACQCVGTAVTNLAQLELTTDNDAASTSWDIIPLAGGAAVCGGGGYVNNTSQTLNCDLPDGCYRLRVYDANMDGLCCMNGIGGFVLRTAGGQRIIDAAGAGIFSGMAEVSLGFCVPIGGDKLTPSRCDREDYLPSDFIQATPNPAVQAQFNVGAQSDDGYQFWIFNPNGGYSRRVLVTHATNNYLFPAGPDRCSYLKLNSLTTSQIPHNMLVNVRVRSMVNGVYSEFGSACRLKIDLTNQCPTTQLLDDNSNHQSCGLTNVPLNGSRTLYALPVSGATNYQFEFSKPGYLRKISTTGSSLVLTQWYTLPLQYNSTYQVRVRVSFDSGANYCPFSTVCTLSTATTPPGNQNAITGDEEAMELTAWPNPNRGEVITLNLVGFGDESAQELVISVTDLFGKTLHSERMMLEGDVLNTTIDMQGYAAGIYLVNVVTADRSWTERVVVQ